MNGAIHALFVMVFTIPFLAKTLGAVPRVFSLLPEAMSGLLFVFVLLRAGHFKEIAIDKKYIILFLLFCVHIILGALLNAVQPGTFLSGLRNYFKYAPLFLVPAVYKFSEKQIISQFRLLLFLGLSQLLFVIVQKFVLDKFADDVAGTLGVGSVLSIYLICVISILLGFYLRKFISTKYFIFLIIFLFIPTTLNETKSIVIFLPFALMVVLMLSGISKEMKVRVFGGAALFAVMFSTFAVVYSAFFSPDKDRGLVEFFMNPDKGVKYYLYSGQSEEIDVKRALESNHVIIGALPTVDRDENKIRRIDNIILPIRVLSEDPTKLLAGLGIGNASDSFISDFSGKYSRLGGLDVSYTALSIFLWEIGVVGVLVFLTYFYFIFRDAAHLAKYKNLCGNFSVGWAAVVVIFVLSLPYKNFMVFDVLGYLFFYFSGLVAATHWAVVNGEKTPLTK